MTSKEYFSKLNEHQKEILSKVLSIAQKFAPEAEVSMPYGVPGLKLNGKNLIAVAAHKNHFGIYPFSPKVIEINKSLLTGLETSKGTIKFNYDAFPKEKLIEKLVEERKKEINHSSS